METDVYYQKKNEHKPYDFWGDKDKYEQSIKNYINKEGAYTIKFEGETTDNVISGKFSGTLLSHSYTGTWVPMAKAMLSQLP